MKAVPFKVTIIATLALAFMAATQTAQAQEPVLVNIPFAFTAGSTALPAGEYRVQRMAFDSPALSIRSTGQRAATVMLSFTVQANAEQTQSKLVFHRYGNRYFLHQVWIAGSERGRELQKSPQEKEQSLAAHQQTPDQVTIVARLVVPSP